MPVLSFGPYKPDVSDYRGEHTKTALNVVPHGDGYAPFPTLVDFTGALSGQCRGYFFARKADGSVQIFAGTSTKLYTLDGTNNTWTDVSKAAATYSALSADANWQFEQFNNFVFAVQVNAPPQVYNLASSTEFADLGGSPPQAAYIKAVNRFLLLGGLASPNAYRVQWSGLNDTTNWTSGVGQSDYQDLADGGTVRGIMGGETGIIFQDSSIRRMTYAPGSPYVFGIDRISIDDGLYAPYAVTMAGDRVFFCSPQGFKMLVPGGYPTPIGKERVDRTFFADVDTGNLQLLLASTDPTQTRVYWSYKSINGTAAAFDKVLCYDWSLDNWSLLEFSGEYIASLSRPGVTLEGLDTLYGTNIDTIDVTSLDAISSASRASLSAINTNHKAGFVSGPALEATLETPEQGQDNLRMFVRGFRPITDAPTVYGYVKSRSTAQASATTGSEVLVNDIGVCPQRVDTRYARAGLRIPAGTSWTYAAGVEPDVVSTGLR